MKIKSIKKIGHITPRCSCGTGYTEPDVFAITLDNGTELKVEIAKTSCPWTEEEILNANKQVK